VGVTAEDRPGREENLFSPENLNLPFLLHTSVAPFFELVSGSFFVELAKGFEPPTL
jgi:hypothetical protein